MITIDPRPEPDASVLTEAEWHMFLTADAKTAAHVLTGCAAWLRGQKAGASS